MRTRTCEPLPDQAQFANFESEMWQISFHAHQPDNWSRLPQRTCLAETKQKTFPRGDVYFAADEN